MDVIEWVEWVESRLLTDPSIEGWGVSSFLVLWCECDEFLEDVDD